MTLQDQVPTLIGKTLDGQKEQPDFLHSLLPRVLMSEGDVTGFDPTRIVQSLCKETGLNRQNAIRVTELVVRRIISSGIQFLSGPHIREMTCAALAELNFENERKLYTRIGMPLMDYEAIVEQGVKENANQYSNPESCHTWAADRLASEYSLLRLIPHDGAVAHLADYHVKFSMWEQPAESTANRFALLDLKHYPDQAIIQGDRSNGSAYYTNAGHLNYNADIGLSERILKQAVYHPIIKGGVITHLWMGEQQPDVEALWKLTQNIALKSDTAYFAYTFDFSWCSKCGTFSRGIAETCDCGAEGEEIEWYSRITGYYSRVRQFNKGKLAEWRDRRRYNY